MYGHGGMLKPFMLLEKRVCNIPHVGVAYRIKSYIGTYVISQWLLNSYPYR